MTTASAHLCFSMPGTVEFVLFVVRKAVRALDNEDPVLKISAAVASHHRCAAKRVTALLTDFVEGLILNHFSTKLELTLAEVDAPQPSIGKAEDLLRPPGLHPGGRAARRRRRVRPGLARHVA